MLEQNERMSYTIDDHIHRSAAWSAATSARASRKCRFTVSDGREILESCGFTKDFSLESLPTPKGVDEKHEKWRGAVLKAAKEMGVDGFTHGVAAKLINCYLKVRFVLGGYHEHERVKNQHPPIDALLLKQLANENIGGFGSQWEKFYTWRWSKFTSDQYQEVIDHVRLACDGLPLWKIEEHWKGHQ